MEWWAADGKGAEVTKIRFSADLQNIPLRSHALIVMLRMFTARPATKKKLTRIKPTDLTFVFGLKKKDIYDFILDIFAYQ